jgi:anti-anti-sigma factor
LALETATRLVGQITVVAMRGKITLGDASQSVRTLVEALLAENCRNIIFNLSEVPFIDSAGLGALTLTYTKTKAAGGMLKLAAATPRVRDAIEVTMLNRLFPLFPSEQEALASFTPAAAGQSQ